MLQKGLIDGKIVEVITFEQYMQQPKAYPLGYTAIDGNNGYVYPLRGKSDSRPGLYPNNGLCKYKDPTLEEASVYSTDNITDLSKPKAVGELIAKQNKIKQQERTILMNADNIFQPQIKQDDYPAMIALKTAINMKNIDFDSYAHRFGSNVNNDRRLLERSNITLTKLVSICKNLDIKAELILSDSESDVPNPIRDSIRVELTDGRGDDND